MLPVGEVRGRLRRGWSVGSSPRWAVRDLDGETSKIWKGVAPQRSGSQEELVAATGPDHHVSVLLQDDIRAVVEVEDRDGVELGGRTAGLGYCVWVDEVNQCLDDGVVGGVHVGVQREGALSLTVVGSIAFRCNDPVLPAKVSEADVQLMFLAGLPLVTAAVFCHTGHPQGLLVLWRLGAILAALLAPRGPDTTEMDFRGLEEGHHEGLLVLGSMPSNQACALYPGI